MNKYTDPLFASSAAITIDTQQDTLDGQPLEITGTSAALPAIRAVLDTYRAKGLPIVHIVRLYRPDGCNVDICRRELVEGGAEILLAGSSGSNPAAALFREPVDLEHDRLLSGGIQAVGPNEKIIYKPRWGAFYLTPLEDHLRGLGIDTLVFMGCNFPNCPRTSIYEASERDFRVVLVEDGVSGLYERGRAELLNIGVTLMKAADLSREILAL